MRLPWARQAKEPESAFRTLNDVLNEYDLVEVVSEPHLDPFIVVSERPSRQFTDTGRNTSGPGSGATVGEIGSSSPSPFISNMRTEYNRELQGVKGLEKYDRMRKSDGTVRGTLRLVKTPVLGARWFVEAASEKKVDQNAADFVWKCLTEYMSISWSQVLTEALLMLEFGHYMFEKVWETRTVEGKQRTVLKKLGPRHPMDVKEWHKDSNGGPKACTFNSPTGRIEDEYTLPIEKMLVFSFDREAGNIQGVSVLRSAYKHWYYKEQLYKIDAIQKERHGIGIPVIKLPVNYSEDDKKTAENLGRNLRTNERAHVVLPPNWDLIFAKIEGQPVDCMTSIRHHNDEIARNILASSIMEGKGKQEDQIMFLKSSRFIADLVAEVFNQYLIPQLVDFNFMRAGYPKLKARRIGESADWRTISFAVRNLIGAGVLTPDDRLEEHLRDEMDLPPADPDTAREVSKPQQPDIGGNGGQAGPPRQTPPSATPPRGNGGQDQSGGK